MSSGAALEWQDAVARWPSTRGHAALRAYSDAVNTALLERWLPPGTFRRTLKTDLFDEAVGAGLFPLLRSRTEEFLGIDVSDATVAAARAHYPDLAGEQADVRSLHHADGSFDLVVSNSTLDHFASTADLRDALAELRRVTASGGLLVVTLDNPRHPLVAARGALPGRLLRALSLVHYPLGATCEAGELAVLLGELGFRVNALTALMHVPRLVVLGLGAAGVVPLRALRSCEALARLPTCYLTGQFVAARAVKS